MENRNPMLRRHTIDAMFMHWFNTICWVLLLATGVGLIDNSVLQPLCMWWVRIMHAIFGGGAALLEFHIVVGTIWSLGFLIYGIVRFKQARLLLVAFQAVAPSGCPSNQFGPQKHR